jgi:hypothetical protein
MSIQEEATFLHSLDTTFLMIVAKIQPFYRLKDQNYLIAI